MLTLLNFLSDGSSSGSGSNNGNNSMGWMTWVIFGVLIVGMILMMIIPQRKAKKRQEEMMSKLGVGSIITSIGGIVGKVIQLDDEYIWIETGVEGTTTTMKLLRQAIHSIAPAEGSPEAKTQAQAAEEETDEIK